MLQQAQLVVDERYRLYEDLASRDGSRFHPIFQDVSS
jgi:pyruvate-ferredoxin/flavodoxin oxidoreductase